MNILISQKYIINFLSYLLLNLLYIILNCMKDLFRQKGTKTQSATISIISSTIYVILIKNLIGLDYSIIIIGTILANMFGDFIGRIIGEKFLPRGTVCYRFTISKEFHDINNINNYLEEHDFGYKWENGYSLHKTYLSYQIYTKNKQEDKQIEALLSLYKIDKFNRSESKSFNIKKEE